MRCKVTNAKWKAENYKKRGCYQTTSRGRKGLVTAYICNSPDPSLFHKSGSGLQEKIETRRETANSKRIVIGKTNTTCKQWFLCDQLYLTLVLLGFIVDCQIVFCCLFLHVCLWMIRLQCYIIVVLCQNLTFQTASRSKHTHIFLELTTTQLTGVQIFWCFTEVFGLGVQYFEVVGPHGGPFILEGVQILQHYSEVRCNVNLNLGHEFWFKSFIVDTSVRGQSHKPAQTNPSADCFQDTKTYPHWGLVGSETMREATMSTKTFGRPVLKNCYYANVRMATVLISFGRACFCFLHFSVHFPSHHTQDSLRKGVLRVTKRCRTYNTHLTKQNPELLMQLLFLASCTSTSNNVQYVMTLQSHSQ